MGESFLNNKMNGEPPSLPCRYRTLTVAIYVWEPPVEAPSVGGLVLFKLFIVIIGDPHVNLCKLLTYV